MLVAFPWQRLLALDLFLSHRVDAVILMGGRLPEDEVLRLADRTPLVAIGRSGFDDEPHVAYTWPALTTMRQPTVEIGMVAARALLDELRGHGLMLPTFATDLGACFDQPGS